VIAPIEASILHDQIVAAVGVREQPAPAIVNVNASLRIVEKRADDRILGNQLEVTGIDFDNVQRFDFRVMDQNLRPRTGRKADHQDTDRAGVKGGNGKGSDDQVLVADWIDVELAVIHSAAEDGAIVQHGDHAVPVLDKTIERGCRGHGGAGGQAFMKAGMRRPR
jgi:hypothetical protein